MAQREEALVRQYELLLVRRRRFELHHVISCIERIVHTLERAEKLLQEALDGQENPGSRASAPALPTSFRGVMENTQARVQQLSAQVPVFISDTELDMFVCGLHNFIEHAEWGLFWSVEMGADEKKMAEGVTNGVWKALKSWLNELESAMADAAPATAALRKKREALVGFIDGAKQLVAEERATQQSYREQDKQKLLAAFKEAVNNPTLQRARQLEKELVEIEKLTFAKLAPHLEICEIIQTANARLVDDGTYSEDEAAEINIFVRELLECSRSTEEPMKHNFRDFFANDDRLLKRIELFENAAKQDSFVVCSRAIRLNFSATLGGHLFRAFLADRKAKADELKSFYLSENFKLASHEVEQLRHQFMQVANSPEKTSISAFDSSIKSSLPAELKNVFIAEGANITEVADVFG